MTHLQVTLLLVVSIVYISFAALVLIQRFVLLEDELEAAYQEYSRIYTELQYGINECNHVRGAAGRAQENSP